MIASTQRTLLGTLALTIVALGTACSNPSTQPSKTAVTPAAVAPKVQAKVTALELSGPATAFVGATSAPEQLVATATLDDGSVSVVTARTTWSSSRPDILRSGSTPGQVQGVAPGEAVVTATVDGVSADYIVRVVRRFRLSGMIRTADTGGPLRGAIITAWGASYDEAEWSTTSAVSGAYVVNTVTGPVEIVVYSPGFASEVHTLSPTQDTVIDFTLRPLQASDANVTGMWHATLSASPTCRDLLPSTGRDREYDVTITQESAQLLFTISSPTMVGYPGQSQGGSRVEVLGALQGTGVSSSSMRFGDLLNPAAELGVIGGFSGALVDGEIRGNFSGVLEHWAIPLATAPASRCVAVVGPMHSIVFRRK